MTKGKKPLTNTHHVVPNPNGGWDVKRGNAERASNHSNTQKEAITIATHIAQNQGTELKIHGKDGQIRESNSYGNDNFPPK